MPFVLHASAVVLCLHGGKAQATAPYPRVRVEGQPVVTQAAPHIVVDCPTGPAPCVTAQWVTGALRVRVGGVPVLLQTSQAVCLPSGAGVNIVATQTRVQAQ